MSRTLYDCHRVGANSVRSECFRGSDDNFHRAALDEQGLFLNQGIVDLYVRRFENSAECPASMLIFSAVSAYHIIP